MRIRKVPKQLLLASGLLLLSSSVFAQRVHQVGAGDADGSPNQVAPAISQSGSVPPPLTAQQLMEFREAPSYSISQPKADPCINNPCLKAAEQPGSVSPTKHEETDQDLFRKGGESIGKDIVVDVLIEKGKKGKWLGIAGAEAAQKGVEWVESPYKSTLKVIPKVGNLIGRGSSAALGVFFEGSMIGDQELPIAIRKEQDARNAAAKASRLATFENIQRENVDQQRQKDAMNAAAAASPSSNSTAVFVDMLNMTAQQYAQQESAAKAVEGSQANTPTYTPSSSTNSAPSYGIVPSPGSNSSAACNKVYNTPTGCHPGHDEKSHPGGCRC